MLSNMSKNVTIRKFIEYKLKLKFFVIINRNPISNFEP